VAGALTVRRDLGAGLIASRPGPAAAAPSLGSPLGLAFRLQRASLLGWCTGVVVLGVAYGWIGPTIDAFIGQNKAAAELLAGTGGGSLTDLYFATSFRLMALIATGFAICSPLPAWQRVSPTPSQGAARRACFVCWRRDSSTHRQCGSWPASSSHSTVWRPAGWA